MIFPLAQSRDFWKTSGFWKTSEKLVRNPRFVRREKERERKRERYRMRKTLRVFQIGELYLWKGKRELDVNGRVVQNRPETFFRTLGVRPILGSICDLWCRKRGQNGGGLAQSSVTSAICGAKNTGFGHNPRLYLRNVGAKKVGFWHNPRLYLRFVVTKTRVLGRIHGYICEM